MRPNPFCDASGRYRVPARRTRTLAALAAFVVMFGLCLPTFAQERFGELTGTVMDPSGAMIPNAAVVLTNTGTGRTTSLQTTGIGAYDATDMEPGRYKVRIEAKGFSATEFPDVELLVGKTLRLDAKLTIGSATETVQVTDAAPLIDVGGNTVAHNITAEEFDRLPKGRTFQSLVVLSPSVNTGQLENGFQVNGASAAENAFTIDGISTNSIITGASRQDAVFEILQEVQIKTGGVDAEYGGALGGVISGITKSGGNTFHGDVHYYFSGNAISAGPVQRLLLNPADNKTVSFVQDHKDPSKNNEVGYSFGGPLIKNKLFFFSAASPRFTDRTNNYLANSGTSPFSINRTQTFWQAFNKVTFEPTSRLRGSVSWQWSPTKSTGSLPAYDFQGNGTTSSLAALAPRAGIGFFAPQSNYGASLDYTVSPTMLVSLRGGRFWDNYKDTGIPGFAAVQYQTPTSSLPANLLANVPASQVGATGFYNTPRLQSTYHDLGARTYVQLDVSKNLHFAGSHDLKGGWGVQKNVNNVDLGYPGGAYVFVFWGRSFTSTATKQVGTGTYGYYEVDDFRTKGTTGATMANFYLQDKWSFKRLTINAGMRFETENIPTFHREIRDDAFSFGFGDKMAPRIGATYDLKGNGKIKLYGAWGRYYQNVPYSLPRGAFGADYWHVYYRALNDPNVFALSALIPNVAATSGTNLPGANLWTNVTGSSRDRRALDFNTVAKGIKPIDSDQMNGGAEFQIGPQMVFRAGYVRSSLGRTIEDQGFLDAQGNESYAYGNPGEGDTSITPTSGATKPFTTPKPVRTYNALELSLTKRYSNGWLASASYVLSRLYGNYPGLSNTDEVRTPTTGTTYSNAQNAAGTVIRNGDAASRAWDLDEILFDSHGNLDVKGLLPTDRTNVVKLYGSHNHKWGGRKGETEIGGNFFGGSGTPLSTYAWTINGIPVFVNGRGDLGRTEPLFQTDAVIAHTLSIGEKRSMRFEFNVINLFNQKTAIHRFVDYNRQTLASSQMNLSAIDLTKGYDYKALVAKSPDGANALDPRFGQNDLFNPGLAARFGIKFTF